MLLTLLLSMSLIVTVLSQSNSSGLLRVHDGDLYISPPENGVVFVGGKNITSLSSDLSTTKSSLSSVTSSLASTTAALSSANLKAASQAVLLSSVNARLLALQLSTSCASSPCQNGGVCSDHVSGFNCSCAQGYSGIRCETNINECASSPCQNGGVCSDLVNGFNCSCAQGYQLTGNFCESGTHVSSYSENAHREIASYICMHA